MIIETDKCGRLLCPNCGSDLYAAIEVHASGIPAFAGDNAYGLDDETFDVGNATWIETNLTGLHCQRCGARFRPGKFEVR